MGGIVRYIRALGRNAQEWDPADLVALARIEQEIGRVRDQAVRAMQDAGITNGQIAAALGVTPQYVSKRWPGGGRYVGAAGRYRSPQNTTTEAPSC